MGVMLSLLSVYLAAPYYNFSFVFITLIVLLDYGFNKKIKKKKKNPKFLRQNHDPRDIYLQEGHIFVSLFYHVYWL